MLAFRMRWQLVALVLVVSGGLVVRPAHAARVLHSDISTDSLAAIRDVARQERSETMRTQISRAMATGANKEVVAHATGAGTRVGSDEFGHLDRRLLWRRLADAFASDGLRSSAQQARAAASTSIIRQAATGTMSVRDAVSASQADDVDRLTLRAAAPIAAERTMP